LSAIFVDIDKLMSGAEIALFESTTHDRSDCPVSGTPAPRHQITAT